MNVIATGLFSAHAFPVGLPGGDVRWFVVVKQTFSVRHGQCVPHEIQVPIFTSDTKHDGHLHTSDIGLHKEGCDVVVLGEAVSLRPVERSEVRVRVGSLDRTLVVTGDRVWEQGWFGTLRPTQPRPFERMPLTWAHAYGGTAIVDDQGTELAWPDNPEGRGFSRPGSETAAEGVVLPNVEWPDRPIREWSDQPEPAGTAFYPSTWGLRLARAIQPRANRVGPPTIVTAAFNQSHPAFGLPRLPNGAARVDGANPGSFSVDVPTPTVRATLVRPSGPIDLPILWDLLVLEPTTSRVVVAGRTTFRYDPETDWAAHVIIRSGGAA